MNTQTALEPRKFEPFQRVRAKIRKDRKYGSGLIVLRDVVLNGKIVGLEDGRNLGRHITVCSRWAYHVALDKFDDTIFIVPKEDLEDRGC